MIIRSKIIVCLIMLFGIGYQGIKKDYPEQLSALPYKKKISQEELHKKK
jgi:hypothetical protein